MESVFEKVDTGDEGLPLNTIPVKVIRVTVGGCDKDNPMGH
jgi:hypothetical protein